MEPVITIVNFLVTVFMGFAILGSAGIILMAGWSLFKGRRIDPWDIGILAAVLWLIPFGIREFAPAVLWAMLDSWQQSEEPAGMLMDEVNNWVQSGLPGDEGGELVLSLPTAVPTLPPTPQPQPTEQALLPVPTVQLQPTADIAAITTRNAELLLQNPPTATPNICRSAADFGSGCVIATPSK